MKGPLPELLGVGTGIGGANASAYTEHVTLSKVALIRYIEQAGVIITNVEIDWGRAAHLPI